MPLPASAAKRALTEDALVLLASARRSLLTRASSRPRHGGRSLRLGSRDAYTLQREAVLFRYVSIVEAYCDALMLEMMAKGIPVRVGMVSQIVAEFEESVTSTGARRRDGFAKLHGIDFAKLASWAEIQASSHVRNSIAHGLGRLTPMQRGNTRLAAQVKPVKVEVRGNRIHMSDDTLDLVFTASRQFILALDAASLP